MAVKRKGFKAGLLSCAADTWLQRPRTFFADKFLCGRAEVLVEFPRFLVVHPSDLYAILDVLPVVWLVRRPRKEVLGQLKVCLLTQIPLRGP